MKKFVVLLVVVAMTLISAMAYAADVTLGGTVQVRSRDFSSLSLQKHDNSGDQRDTQERIQLDVNAKAGDVKGKISIWNDFDTWGRFESVQGNGVTVNDTAGSAGKRPGTLNFFGIREAWINFNLPGVPVNVTAGHQLLSLGQGYFFRSMHFGSDAWVVANQTGNNTAAFVNVKVSEVKTNLADDIDAYVFLDVFKLNDKNTVGIDITEFKDRKGTLSASNYFGLGNTTPLFESIELQNVGLNYNGDLGVLKLKAEADFQFGKAKDAGAVGKDVKFKGNQFIIQGAIPVDPLTINFTLARGSGNKDEDPTDGKQIINALDVDPHYTFLYEYKIGTRASNYLTGSLDNNKNLGFANTTAFNVGATFAATKSLTVGADLWLLQATEKVSKLDGGTGTTSDLGQEIDLKLNWNIAENLSWNWVAGLFKAGAGMGDEDATGIQGILAFKF